MAGWLALACFFVPAFGAELDDRTRIQIEALNRLKGMDLEANPALKNAVLKVVEKTRGTPHFVELVREFELEGQEPALLEYALEHPDESAGVEAFRLAMRQRGSEALPSLLISTNAVSTVRLIGNSGAREFRPLLQELVTTPERPVEVRKEAVRALVKSEDGARFLLELEKQGRLPADLRLTASSELSLVSWPAIRNEAREVLPLPQGQDAEPLPPISELSVRTGDPKRGKEIFFSATAACGSCHQVNGAGMNFGPNLSEIGSKLGKEALYESILDPSAGISFGYEAWSIVLKNGDEAYGIITSETAGEVTVKTQTGILTTYQKAEIERRRKMSTSIMPMGLQLTMSTRDLIDLVEYLSTLKKPE